MESNAQLRAMAAEKLKQIGFEKGRALMRERGVAQFVPKLESIGLTVSIYTHTNLQFQLDKLDTLNVVHIAGTKGKGSTCAYVEAILRSKGYKTGLYTYVIIK